jgi:beta-glucosidase
MLAGLVLLVACLAVRGRADGGAKVKPLYMDPKAPVERRIDDLLPRMTLEEKITMIHGDADATGMDTRPIARLGIPKLSTSDGPHGVRWGTSTAFPPGISLASTWNDALIEKVGVAIGRETLAHGRNIILGPCVNIHRVPFGGRNFESYSEDPYLAGRIAVGYIKGVQSQHVVATVKHYAVNNQEWERGTISVEIDERTLREIYLPQFEAAIKQGGSYSLMCSYNRINGVYACENKHLMTDILKNEWGFKGFAMSDWGAVHSTVNTAMAGLDLEMPTGAYTSGALLEAVKAGKVPVSKIDDKVRRILRVMFTTGIFDKTIPVNEKWLDSKEHRDLALKVAQEEIVLLKNDGDALPLDRNKIKTLAVIGPNASEARMGGGGSSTVTPNFSISPLEGIRAAAGGVEIKYAQGCDLQLPVDFQIIPNDVLTPEGGKEGEHGVRVEYFNGGSPSGTPLLTRVEKQIDFNWGAGGEIPGLNSDSFSIRWRAKLTPKADGKYKITSAGDGVSQLFVNGKPKINNWSSAGGTSKTVSMELKAGETYTIRFEYVNSGGHKSAKLGWTPPGWDSISEAANLARESDAAVVFIGLSEVFEGEGRDRDPAGISLPGLQNELVEKVAAANPRTIVVLINGTPLMMDRWIDKVPAIVEAWYPGEAGGGAIAGVLFGDVNPSGRLTITYPHSWEECPAFGNYPGKDGKVYYKEGIYVGYRYYDTKNITPVYPFGYGLSYTTFEYSGLKITPERISRGGKATVSVDVKNTGPRAGKEVAQLYVRDIESSIDRPVRELKGFQKIFLAPGEIKKVTFEVDTRALSFYDPKKSRWVAESGQFEIQVGASSRDIRQKGILTLK